MSVDRNQENIYTGVKNDKSQNRTSTPSASKSVLNQRTNSMSNVSATNEEKSKPRDNDKQSRLTYTDTDEVEAIPLIINEEHATEESDEEDNDKNKNNIKNLEDKKRITLKKKPSNSKMASIWTSSL